MVVAGVRRRGQFASGFRLPQSPLKAFLDLSLVPEKCPRPLKVNRPFEVMVPQSEMTDRMSTCGASSRAEVPTAPAVRAVPLSAICSPSIGLLSSGPVGLPFITPER